MAELWSIATKKICGRICLVGKTTVGYVKFWSVDRKTNYVLVGMERTHTATFGICRVSDLIDLGITLFVK